MPLSQYYRPLYEDPAFDRPLPQSPFMPQTLPEGNETDITGGAPAIPSPAVDVQTAIPSLNSVADAGASSNNPQSAMTQSKPQFLDYLQSYNQVSAKSAIDNANKLAVSPEDIQRSQERQNLLSLQQGLSAANSQIGNVGGKVADNEFAKYLENQVQGERNNLKQRQDAFSGAQQQVQQATKGLGEIADQQQQQVLNPLKLQQQQQALKQGEQNLEKGALDIQETQYKGDQLRRLRDPNSEESMRARQLAAPFAKGLGVDLGNMSGEEIMSKFPTIEKAFSSKEDRQFKLQQAREARDARMQELSLKVGEAKQGKTKSDQQIESDLRKEYNQLPIVKQFNDVDAGFRKIQESKAISSSSPQRAPADIAMVFNFMKMLDPGSTVREGEYATAKNAAGVPDIVLNQYNKLKDGQFLTPEQREGFFNEAKSAYMQHVNQVKEQQKLYGGIADKYGLETKYLFGSPGENSIKPATQKQGTVDISSLPVTKF